MKSLRCTSYTLLLLLSSLVVQQKIQAQITGAFTVYTASHPTGACSSLSALRFDYADGTLWGCSASTWAQIGGGGGGGTCATLAGDVSGTCAANTVGKINGVALSGLATGILKNTTTTGVPSIAVAGTDYAAANASTTVNGQTCTLSLTCTISASNITTGTLPAAQTAAALSSTTSVNGTSIPSGVTLTQTIASGTSALGTSAISSGACATVVTTSATGTATTDNIQADFNADPTSTTGYSASATGMLTIIKYPTANNVNFKVCNNTGSSITPGATVTLNWRVVR